MIEEKTIDDYRRMLCEDNSVLFRVTNSDIVTRNGSIAWTKPRGMFDTRDERSHQTQTKANPLDAQHRRRANSEGKDNLIEDRRENESDEHHVIGQEELTTRTMVEDTKRMSDQYHYHSIIKGRNG